MAPPPIAQLALIPSADAKVTPLEVLADFADATRGWGYLERTPFLPHFYSPSHHALSSRPRATSTSPHARLPTALSRASRPCPSPQRASVSRL